MVPQLPPIRNDMPDQQLDILYRDDHLVAVHKPAGLLVHRSPIDRHETRFALQLVRNQIGCRVYPVHRLDKPTSGVLLFALRSEVAQQLTVLFESRQVRKTYLAVVRGIPTEQGAIDYPLYEEEDRLAPLDPEREAQPAVTLYRRLAEVELPIAVGRYATSRYALLELQPQTGRRRQLRRHMKHIFHPIIGDTTYGDGRHNRMFRDTFDCRRLLLAATRLEFPHPVTGDLLQISAAPEDSFTQVLQRLGWELSELAT